MSILKVNTIQDKGGNTLLSSDGAGTLTLPSDLKMTPSFLAYVNSGQSISNATWTVVSFETELYDTGSCYDTSTYKFTPNVAGKYYFTVKIRQEVQGISNFQIRIEKNEETSSYTFPNVIFYNNRPFNYDMGVVSGILDANGTTDNFRVRYYGDGGAGSISASFGSFFSAYRIIGA